MKYVEASNNRELQGRKSMGQEKCIFGCHPLPPEKKKQSEEKQTQSLWNVINLKSEIASYFIR